MIIRACAVEQRGKAQSLQKSIMEGSSTEDVKELTEDELMAEGRRAMVCKEFSKAASSFEEACGIISVKYGQISKEMGEPSYLYGKSLLELARIENALFGSNVPVPQENEEEDESENESENNNEESDIEENEPVALTDQDHASLETDTGPSGAVGSSSKDIPNTDNQLTSEEDKGEDEPTTLQLAWEMFEVARVIYETTETLEDRLRLADINMLLGEVSLESDEFSRAIDDFVACLKIRELVVKPEDRLLAEVHFQLGLANTFAMNFDDAITEYELAKQVIELRKEILQGKLDRNNECQDVTTVKEEISELNELLPDIDSKINDVYEIKKKSLEALEEESSTDNIAAIGEVTTTNAGCSSQISETKSHSQVNDISHLMRKKSKRNENHDPNKSDNTVSSTVSETSRKRPVSETSEDACSSKRIQVDSKQTSCYTIEQ